VVARWHFKGVVTIFKHLIKKCQIIYKLLKSADLSFLAELFIKITAGLFETQRKVAFTEHSGYKGKTACNGAAFITNYYY